MGTGEELLRNSEQRLWALIEERSRPDADVAAIDARIWELFGEDWAVMFTDLAGFSRRAERFGIIHFLQIIHEKKRLLVPLIARENGFLVKTEADSFLILFRTPDSALRCAVEMQRACQAISARRVEEEKLLLCVGVGYGRVLRIGAHEVWGSEVNAASKLGEDTAGPDEILVTGSARAALAGSFALQPTEIAVPGSQDNFALIYPRAGEP